MNKALRYGSGLIALYLVVVYASGSGKVLETGTAGVATITRAFQGR